MHKVITQFELWSNFKNDPPLKTDGGFMFSDKKWIRDINSHPLIVADGHSGASSAMTLRYMEYIALNGWVKFIEGF